MRDKDFFDSNIDMDRVETVLMETVSKLTLSEILKMVREISYDMVCKAMYETGINLSHQYRETSEGGLARFYNRRRGARG